MSAALPDVSPHGLGLDGPQFGTVAPGFTLLSERGKPVSLKGFYGKKYVALIFCPALFLTSESILELRSLRKAAEELEKLDTVILEISFNPPKLNHDVSEKERIPFRLLSDQDRAVAKSFGVLDAKSNRAQQVTYFLDKEGVIRAIDRRVNPATHGRDLVNLVKTWLQGKQLYQGVCARCHGADGNDTEGYPNIKSLKSIGNQHGEEEILELTSRTGIVNIEAWSDQERQALAKYVRGL